MTILTFPANGRVPAAGFSASERWEMSVIALGIAIISIAISIPSVIALGALGKRFGG